MAGNFGKITIIIMSGFSVGGRFVHFRFGSRAGGVGEGARRPS